MIDAKEVDTHTVLATYDPTKNKTAPRLTRYEKAKIIGLRLEQIRHGAQPLVKIDARDKTTVRDIVLKELNERMLPFMIARTLANVVKEYWRLEDMELDEDE